MMRPLGDMLRRVWEVILGRVRATPPEEVPPVRDLRAALRRTSRAEAKQVERARTVSDEYRRYVAHRDRIHRPRTEAAPPLGKTPGRVKG